MVSTRALDLARYWFSMQGEWDKCFDLWGIVGLTLHWTKHILSAMGFGYTLLPHWPCRRYRAQRRMRTCSVKGLHAEGAHCWALLRIYHRGWQQLSGMAEVRTNDLPEPSPACQPWSIGQENLAGVCVTPFTQIQFPHEQDMNLPTLSALALLTQRDGWPTTFMALLKASGPRSSVFLSTTSSSMQGQKKLTHPEGLM